MCEIHLPIHTAQFVHVYECHVMKWIQMKSETGDHLHMALTPQSSLHPLSSLHYLLLLSFNLCRQGRHQSEWQVVWSPFRVWWEKECCQHKYPSRIHDGHSCAVAPMNLHPLSRAEKHKAISVALKPCRRPLNVTLLPTNKQNWQFIGLFLIVCSFICLHRQADRNVLRWICKHLHTIGRNHS